MLNPAQGHQFRNPELGLLSSCNGMAVVSSHVPFRRNPSASWAMASSALGSACHSRRERFLVMSALALPRLGTLLKHRWGNNDWITRSANSYALMLVALILEGPVVDAFEKCSRIRLEFEAMVVALLPLTQATQESPFRLSEHP